MKKKLNKILNKNLMSYLLILIFSFSIMACSNKNINPTGNTVFNNTDNSEKIIIYFFWGEGCPHCETEKIFLNALQSKYSQLEIKTYETWKNPENAKLFQDMARDYGFTPAGVPTTFISEKYWIGYADYLGVEMEDYIKKLIEDESWTNLSYKLRGE